MRRSGPARSAASSAWLAAVVALGPVILPYDEAFLGVTSGGLAAINPRLIHFLQHDRITLAGTMVAIGILYSALAWSGIRKGRVWARDALLASGLVGFPTLFYFSPTGTSNLFTSP